MLFGQIKVDEEFSYYGQRYRKIEKRKIPIGLGFTNQNIELVDNSNGFASGYLVDSEEVVI